MKGAIAAGHPLTARGRARASSTRVATPSTRASRRLRGWVAESPLTGPGAGGFMLVHRAGTARRGSPTSSSPAWPRPRARPKAPRCTRRRRLRRRRETTQVFRIGAASCAVPGAAAGLEAVHRRYGRLPWAELVAPAVELARAGVELTRPQAHLHAILDLDPAPHGRGTPPLQPPRRLPPAAGRCPAPPGSRRDARADRGAARPRSTAASSRDAIVATVAGGRRRADAATTSRPTR